MKREEYMINRGARQSALNAKIMHIIESAGYTLNAVEDRCNGCTVGGHAIMTGKVPSYKTDEGTLASDDGVIPICCFLHNICGMGKNVISGSANNSAVALLNKMPAIMQAMQDDAVIDIDEAQYRDEGEPGLYVYGSGGARLVCVHLLGGILDFVLSKLDGQVRYPVVMYVPPEFLYNRNYLGEEVGECIKTLEAIENGVYTSTLLTFLKSSCQNGMTVTHIKPQ